VTQTNLYRALRELLPEPPLQVATVAAVHAGEGSSTVTFPGGGVQRVRGTAHIAGTQVFVRNGLIEGAAPALTPEVIEV